MSFFTVAARCPGPDAPGAEGDGPDAQAGAAEFRRVEAELLGEAGAAAAPFAKTMTQAAVCLANEMVGGAERLRESALDYAKLRMQFGRPIASFQSMKHKQADMLVDVELAKSAAYYAAAAVDEDERRSAGVASLAKACASEAYMQTAIHAIQIHGGIGFTWDNDTHLWFKRAKSSEVFLGDPTLSSRTDAAALGAREEETDHDRTDRSLRPRRSPRLAGGELEPRSRPGRVAHEADRLRLGRAALAEGMVRPRPAGGVRRRRRGGDSRASARSASPRPASARSPPRRCWRTAPTCRRKSSCAAS